MIIFLAIVYILGAIATGMFIELNSHHNFIKYFNLNYLFIDDGFSWLIVLFWPEAIPVLAIGIFTHYYIKKLYNNIDKWIRDNKKKEDITEEKE